MPRQLIPDTLGDALKPVSPENKNRARTALSSITHHKLHVGQGACGPVVEEDVIDLLTNLRHACEQAGYNFDELSEVSLDHFVEETAR
jgi:hypothetical protein